MATGSSSTEAWVAEETIDRLSSDFGEPPAQAEYRREALKAFRELALEPNPLYRKYGYWSGVDLTGLDPRERGPAIALPGALPNSIVVMHDGQGTRAKIPPSLVSAGVEFQSYPELLRGSGAPHPEPETSPPLEFPDRLGALGAALTNRGYRLRIPSGVSEPVQLHDFLVLSIPHEARSVRRVIEVGDGVTFLGTEETYSLGTTVEHQRWCSSEVSIHAGRASRVAFLTVHSPDPLAVSYYARQAVAGPESHLSWVFSGFGGFRTKIRNSSTLLGNASDVEDLQSFYGDGDQSYDSSVNLTHKGTDTHGQSITRGVFKDRSRGMSRGLVRIEHEARKTLSFLSEHAMLLSRGTRSDTIPILEILCRDVKATHSSSVAPVDPEKVFYLESRGLPESEAIRAIGEGFLSHVLGRAPISRLREILYPLLTRRWEGHAVAFDAPGIGLLPELAFSTGEEPGDWRFDTKLR